MVSTACKMASRGPHRKYMRDPKAKISKTTLWQQRRAALQGGTPFRYGTITN